MRGRIPAPIQIKRARGDTKKIGAKKFAKQTAAAMEARVGRPECPPGLDSIAKKHWEYLADQLQLEGLLTKLDQGMLTAAAVVFSALKRAAPDPKAKKPHDHRAIADLTQRYMQLADRMGLNASARARLPKQEKKVNTLEDALCG